MMKKNNLFINFLLKKLGIILLFLSVYTKEITANINTNENNSTISNEIKKYFLLDGNELSQIVRQTLYNQYKLYNYLTLFPVKIHEVNKYLPLYSICSYLSPIFSCEITKSLNSNLKSLDLTFFPWILTNKRYKWKISTGAFGSVVCGEISNKYNKNNINYLNIFLINNYMISNNLIWDTFVYFKKSNQYKELEYDKNIQICIKTTESFNDKNNFYIWNIENYNLKLLEKDLWIFNNKFIKFTPKQIFLISSKINELKNESFSEKTKIDLNISKNKSKLSIFSPSIYKSSFPWNNISGKYWSSFLMMEKFNGITLFSIYKYISYNSVINWTMISKKNLYLWYMSIVNLIHLFFSTILTFTFTSNLIYQHCDMNVSNLIFISSKLINYSNQKLNSASEIENLILEIISLTLDKVKIIDLTFIQVYNIDNYNSSVCNENFMLKPDIINWATYLYLLDLEVRSVSKYDSNSNINPTTILINLMESDHYINENIMEHSKVLFGTSYNTFETFYDLYSSILNISNYLNKTIEQINNQLIFDNKNMITFSNPIDFGVYLRSMFFVPYNLMLFGNYLFNHESFKEYNSYFLLTIKTITYYLIVNNSKLLKPLKWIENEMENVDSYWNNYQESDLFKNSYNLNNKFFEPCNDHLLCQKSFPIYIDQWIENNNNSENDFYNNSIYLMNNSDRDIEFILSLLTYYHLSSIIKTSELKLNKDLLLNSMMFSKSILKILKIDNILNQLDISDHLCLKIYKDIFKEIDETFNFAQQFCYRLINIINYNK